MIYDRVTQRSHCNARNDFLKLIDINAKLIESLRLRELSMSSRQ